MYLILSLNFQLIKNLFLSLKITTYFDQNASDNCVASLARVLIGCLIVHDLFISLSYLS